jgi:hypothetical protein
VRSIDIKNVIQYLYHSQSSLIVLELLELVSRGRLQLNSRDPSLTIQARRMLSTMQAKLPYISLLRRRDLFGPVSTSLECFKLFKK